MADKKLVRSKSGLRIVALTEDKTSPFLTKEPEWIPDNKCKACMKCMAMFDFMKRRHHCRRCGKCFCGKCCDSQIPLPRMCFVDPVRQCEDCAGLSKKENEFFDRHLKTLTSGGHFRLEGSEIEKESPSIYVCKISADHRFMQFEGPEHQLSIDPVELASIETLEILTSGTHPNGNVIATGVQVHYKDACEVGQDIQMYAVENSMKRQAMLWIAALQKGMKLMYENRKA